MRRPFGGNWIGGRGINNGIFFGEIGGKEWSIGAAAGLSVLVRGCRRLAQRACVGS